MTTPVDALSDRVRGAAFRRLLRTSASASASQLADDLDIPEPAVQSALDELSAHGRVRLDTQDRVTGSAGLSIQTDRHEITLDGRRFWTWCAYDVFGIFAALRASGHARSTIPDTGEPVEIHFRDGTPEPAPYVLFRPDDDYARCCTNTYEQWCPNSNLFRTAEAAAAWSGKHNITGRVLTLPEAAKCGGNAWQSLTTVGPT